MISHIAFTLHNNFLTMWTCAYNVSYKVTTTTCCLDIAITNQDK